MKPLHRLRKSYRPVSVALGLCLLVAGAVWLRAQFSPPQKPMPTLMPPGALIYLEAGDFGSLLNRWNASGEKRAWLTSANYSVVSRSRLLGRLQQVQGEFETAVGVSPQMNLLTQVAGKESAFAFYDLGNLKFVYLTKLSSGQLDATELWKRRPAYQQREVAGIPFYEKTEAERTVAFASKDDYFVIATDDNLMAQTLALLAGRQAPSLGGEPWFRDITAPVSNRGSLRLVYNMEQLVSKPQFRTYWIQQTVTEMKQYRAGVCDLFETADSFTEKRMLLRKSALAAASDELAIQRLLVFTPDQSSFYRAWADPTREQLSHAFIETVAGEKMGPVAAYEMAPDVNLNADKIGSASDLETRIDELPAKRGSLPSLDPAMDAILALKPRAALQIQGTAEANDHVFVVPQSTLLLAFDHPDSDALKAALIPVQRALALSGTISWQQAAGTAEWGPLDTLRVREAGAGMLIIARGPSLADPNPPKMLKSSPLPLTYAAGYSHAVAWPQYKRLFGVLDQPRLGADQPVGDGDVPLFFSGNIRSLGDTLQRLQKIRLTSRESGDTLTEEVVYQLR
ncbi:MAG: hypothetical protein WBW33_35170 [Bryobacteraceae bacterium]